MPRKEITAALHGLDDDELASIERERDIARNLIRLRGVEPFMADYLRLYQVAMLGFDPTLKNRWESASKQEKRAYKAGMAELEPGVMESQWLADKARRAAMTPAQRSEADAAWKAFLASDVLDEYAAEYGRGVDAIKRMHEQPIPAPQILRAPPTAEPSEPPAPTPKRRPRRATIRVLDARMYDNEEWEQD